MSIAPSDILDHQIGPMVKTVELRTISFFHDELDLVPTKVERRIHHKDRFMLREITAIVGVGSSEGLYVAFSYSEPLAYAMMKRYTRELSIGTDEEALYMRETASDVVNVIVGNCTADLTKRGEIMTLSPPVLALGARTIQGRPQTAVAVLGMHFPDGMLDIAFVGPKLLFDEHLNYMGEKI